MHPRKRETLVAFIFSCVLSVVFAVPTIMNPNALFIGMLVAFISVAIFCAHRVSILICIASVLVVGCASETPAPSNPKQDTTAGALVGMLLMASAAQDTNSPASKVLKVRITATTLEAINFIEDYWRKFGKWPTTAEIAASANVQEIGVTEVPSGLELMLKSVGTAPFRCTIEKDGTVVVVPPFFQALSRTNQMQGTGQ